MLSHAFASYAACEAVKPLWDEHVYSQAGPVVHPSAAAADAADAAVNPTTGASLPIVRQELRRARG